MKVRTVLVTAPDRTEAESLARSLVRERLAACGNIIPGIRSIYWWEGEVQEDDEVLVLLKTTSDRMEALIRRVRELHPYDVPEVLALPVREGLEEYMTWVQQESREAAEQE